MAYCTQAEIQLRTGAEELIALADLDEDGIADALTVAEAIQDADGHINSYLAVRFVVPIVPVPDVLVKRSTSLSIYFLQLRRNSVTEDVQKEFDWIMKWLADLVAGRATLDAAVLPPEAAGAGTVLYDVQDRVFGRDEPL